MVKAMTASASPHRRVRSTLAVAVAVAAVGAGVTPALAAGTQTHSASPSSGATHRNVYYRGFTGADFRLGQWSGVRLGSDGLTIANPSGQMTYTDPYGNGTSTYDTATWTSPVVHTDFGLEELISSWDASTPNGTWIQVQMRGTTNTGQQTKWYVMGRWASGSRTIHRTSLNGQGDDNGTVYTDTFSAADGVRLRSYQLRVTLLRTAGSDKTPTLRSVGAVSSRLPDTDPGPSKLGGAEGITLNVPEYSQELHHGEYPRFDGGGEAWCSATSTAMVVAYWGKGPSAKEMSWVDPSYADPQVDYTARQVFDWAYDGTGNWPFNTGYAGERGLNSFVTRLRSMNEAEQFIKAGIPVIASVSFTKKELPGAGYSTSGHLMVVVGFDKRGNVVVNDPASHLDPNDASVRTTYNRARFAKVWAHSGFTAYIDYPQGHSLPPVETPDQPNW